MGRAKIPCGAHQGHAGDEPELRRDRTRAWIQDEGAGVQVAPRRDPASATAPSARSLFLSDDPQSVGAAGQRAAARLLVGRIDGAQTNDAPAYAVQPGGGGQKSDCAAAIAAFVIGDGANTNKMIASAETASTMRATGLGRSNAGAGSSKYISLTILR